MAYRFQPLGQMLRHPIGNYVLYSDYASDTRTLVAAVVNAFTRGKSVQAGEMAVTEAASAIAVFARINGLDEELAKEIRQRLEEVDNDGQAETGESG